MGQFSWSCVHFYTLYSEKKVIVKTSLGITRHFCQLLFKKSIRKSPDNNKVQWNLVIIGPWGPWKVPCYIWFLVIPGCIKNDINSWDQQNYLGISARFCYIWPLYNKVPLYYKLGCLPTRTEILQNNGVIEQLNFADPSVAPKDHVATALFLAYTGWPRKNATTLIVNFKDIINKTEFILWHHDH